MNATPFFERQRAISALSLVLFCAGLVSACGGGGGSGSEASPASSSSNLVGVVQKGPVAKALVTAFPVDANGVVGTTAIASVSSDAKGGYTLPVGSYAGTVQLVATAQSGTTMADEASGATVTPPAGFAMHSNAVVAVPSGGTVSQTASITPYTELANNIAKSAGGITATNIVNANGVVFSLIGMDPVATLPVASNVAPPAGATEVQKRYGLFNAAISQLASSAPKTTDPATLACFSAAGSDTAARVQCAITQIAGAVTVTGSGAQALASGNVNLVGLSTALVSVSANTTINQTGTSIADSDSFVMTLQSQESAATSGTPVPIASGPVTQQRSDVATAKLFFSNLRSNATVLRSGPFDTGIADGMTAFGNSLNGDVASFTVNTVNLVQLVNIAHNLWLDYANGVTSNPNTQLPPGNYYGCTIYQGTFPTSFGGSAGANGQPYVSSSVTATSPANATWVGCSVNTGPLSSNGAPRYRQTMIFDLSTPAGWTAVNYLASTRKQFINTTDGQTYVANISPTFTGTVGITTQPPGTDNGYSTINGYSIKGDLPPEPTSDGKLLAAHYTIDVNAALTVLASGADQLTLSEGQIGVVPVGGTSTTLSLDLSSGGQLVAVFPVDYNNTAQVTASQILIQAKLSEPDGQLTGSLLFDQAVLIDNAWQPGHAKFVGSIEVAPIVSGSAGAAVTWTSLTLEATHPVANTSTVSFKGNVALPGLPQMTLQGSVNQTSANDFTLQASYVQDSLNVTITGTQHSPSDRTFTFADASGVSVTLTGAGSSATVTVSGRQAAVIDKGSDLINYSDGTFETLINP